MPYPDKYHHRQSNPKCNGERVEYAYYPDGDIDPNSRRTRIGLICEGGEWRIMGSTEKLSPERLQKIRENIESGRGEIHKIVSDSRRADGRGDLFQVRPSRSRARAA